MNPNLVREMGEITERLGWVLLHSLWQGCLVAVALVIGLWLTRHRSAALRHLLCLTAMGTMLSSVAATGWWLRAEAPSPTVATTRAIDTSTGFDTPAVPLRESGTPPVFPEKAATLESAPVPTHDIPGTLPPDTAFTALNLESALGRCLPWIGTAWMLGVILLSLRHLGGWWHVHAIRRGARLPLPGYIPEAIRVLAERFGLSRAVRVQASARVFSPMLAGVLKPVILLPASLLTGLRRSDVEAILAHELAHFARWDSWTNLFQIFVETILFYHPAIWWISNRARIERENAADDLAIRALREDRLSYAQALARLAELEHDEQALAVAANDGSILSRLRRVVRAREETEPAGAGWLVAGVIALLCLTFVPLHAQENRNVVKVNAGEPLQAAIDAAAPGSIIQLGEGEWKERIVITKPLTLEGAGWEKTIIKPDQPPPGATAEAKAEFRKRFVRGIPAELAAALNREWVEKFAVPTLLVRNAENVSLRGVRIGGIAPENIHDAGADALVRLTAAKASLESCAIVGPFGNGIQITDGSDVEITNTLVAALWGDGITVEGQVATDKKSSRLRLADSEIRNIYHYGVQIGRGCDSTVVERCRISGTAWHGIRYDYASPTITGNAIFKNARSGIYAHGATRATVRGNLFWRNEMDGMSCWFENEDVIEGNTFVGNLRESMMALGSSKPVVKRNIFANSPVAISCGAVAGEGQQQVGSPVLSDNLFWNTPSVVTGSGRAEYAELKTGTDPMFIDVTKQDFRLAADSPARAAGIGLAEPLSPTGPWALLAEEKAIIPDEDTREFTYWGTPGAPKKSRTAEAAMREAYENAKSWLADAFQLEDKAKREAAIESVRRAMTSENPEEVRAALTAFTQLGPIEFDRASFRPIVRKLIASDDISTRAMAVQAFALTGADPEDLPAIFALAEDPAAEVRSPLTGVIVSLTQRDITGKGASDAILKLMRQMPKDPREIAHALWGVKLSPEVEARVLEICKDIPHAGGAGYDFLYGTLSTQANKSEASVKRLIELLAHLDTTNIAGRSAWGLQQGVAPAQYPLLADAMVRVIEARSDGYLRNNAIRCLQKYGSAAQAPALKALLAKPGTTGDFRKTLETTLAEIEARPAPSAGERQ